MRVSLKGDIHSTVRGRRRFPPPAGGIGWGLPSVIRNSGFVIRDSSSEGLGHIAAVDEQRAGR